MKDLIKAVQMLKNKYEVMPEKYTIYGNSYLFLAYPPGIENKEQYLSPWYIVDVKKKLVGPFSPAFDLDNFFKSIENLRDL